MLKSSDQTVSARPGSQHTESRFLLFRDVQEAPRLLFPRLPWNTTHKHKRETLKHTQAHTHTNTQTHEHTNTQTHKHTNADKHTRDTHTHNIYIYIYISICIYIDMFIHTRAHAQTLTHTITNNTCNRAQKEREKRVRERERERDTHMRVTSASDIPKARRALQSRHTCWMPASVRAKVGRTLGGF